MTRLLVTATLTASLWGATNAGVRHVTIGTDDLIKLHAGVLQYSSIVLDENEKALTTFCGDPKHWDIQVIEGAERFVLIKPAVVGRTTDIQVVTNLGHNYTVQATSDANQDPIDLKVFVEPEDQESLKKAPALYSESAIAAMRTELEASKQREADLQTQHAAELKQQADRLTSSVPSSLHFDYSFEENKPPFNIKGAWHDGKFTYIKVDHPNEVAAVYTIKDKAPMLENVEYSDGLYKIRSVVDGDMELRLGKKSTRITHKATS